MKKIIIISLTLIAYTSFAQDGAKNFIDQNYIEVIGIAQREILPNEIFLKVVINEKDNKGKESLEQLEQSMIAELQTLGLDIEKQLSVKDLTSNFQFYFLMKTDIFSLREYEVLVYDAATAANVIVGLEKIGVSNISISKMDHSEIESIAMDLKQEAVVKAKEKAIKLANALGQDIGKAIYIDELDDSNIANVLSGKVAGLRIRGVSSIYGSQAATAANVNFDKVKMESKILVRFILN